ncbi:MAG: MBOAT family protein [Anaerolineales bacterium]
MSFTTYNFLVFLLIFLAFYWLIPSLRWKNLLLVGGSYLFYGWVASWHVAVIFLSTALDYFLALGMARWKDRAKLLMWVGVIFNIGTLLVSKYYFFFNESLANALRGIGINGDVFMMRVVLPLGLSFYVLKKISYLLDIQRGTFKPTRDFIAYAAYVSFFPQVFSGPIDRPQKLLTQLYEPRSWKAENLYNAWTLLVMGFFKKIVIANTVTVIVDQIFELEAPSQILLLVGGLGFTLQIIADFSSYTDLSRGFAWLLGLNTTENFNRPYLALTPSEFWNRWHISLSTWLRDYVFFPLRRALLKQKDNLPDFLVQSIPPLATMFVSGVWHGVGWKFIVWGLYYGVLIVLYQTIGIRGDWKPIGKIKGFFAWLVMFALIVFGWIIFRAISLNWLWNVIAAAPFYRDANELTASFVLLIIIGFYALLLVLKLLLDRYAEKYTTLRAVYYVGATLTTLIFINSSSPDFIYSQF